MFTPALPAAPPTLSELQSENAALKMEIAALTAKKSDEDADEKLILKKMTFGLTRAQARAVVLRQKTFDATALAKIQKARLDARKRAATH